MFETIIDIPNVSKNWKKFVRFKMFETFINVTKYGNKFYNISECFKNI